MGTPGHSGTSVQARWRPTRWMAGDLEAGGPGLANIWPGVTREHRYRVEGQGREVPLLPHCDALVVNWW
jgi:hypothetical protein